MTTIRTFATTALAGSALALALTGCSNDAPEEAAAEEGHTLEMAPEREVSQLGLDTMTSTIPDTPAGERLRFVLDQINVHYQGLDDELVGAHFAPSVFEEISADELVDLLAGIARHHAPVALVGFREPTTDVRLVAVLRFAGKQYRELVVGVDEAEPHHIVEIRFAEF